MGRGNKKAVNRTVKLLGISGSLTQGGRTRAVVELGLRWAKERFPEIETELLDLRGLRIALCDGRSLAEYPDDTKRAIDIIQGAQAYLIGSPVYRGSYTGALKNLLDHTPLEALMGKPVGLVATAATEHHYLAIDQELRTVLAWFNAFVVPGSVYVQNSHFAGDELADERVREHLRQLAESVVVLETRLRDAPVGPPPLAGWKRR